jgi:hypothetical protein
MPRPRRDSKRPLPPAIEPTAVYTRRDVLALLPWVGYEGIVDEIRAGRLRESRRVGHRVIVGQWVLDWIAAGEAAVSDLDAA